MTSYADPRGQIAPPHAVKHSALVEATQPLLDLCGIDIMATYEVSLLPDEVRVTVLARVEDADKYATGDDEWAVWVRDVVIPVQLG